jgi:hypothetical protein
MSTQDLKPFDQAIQVVMAIFIHLELFVTISAVSRLLVNSFTGALKLSRT